MGDDKRVDLKEWLAGYKGVNKHGFLALDCVEDDESAKALFEQIDNNGGGYILLEEWCEYLKSVEIEQKTPLGDILAEDEEGGVGKKWAPPSGFFIIYIYVCFLCMQVVAVHKVLQHAKSIYSLYIHICTSIIILLVDYIYIYS